MGIIMKALLVALNSKYIHTNIAVRNIVAFCKDFNIDFYEATINDPLDDILEDINSFKADIIGFSCYIWNIEEILYIIENLKKIQPRVKVFLGGPEVSYDIEYFMIKNQLIDGIIIGEGEESFKELFEALEKGTSLDLIDGLAFRNGEDIKINIPKRHVNLDKIPLSYNDDEDLKNKLVYYEASRGCPFGCAFCLSSLDKKLRFSSLEKVEKDFMFFVKKGVKVVKMVDRSFNCNKKRALEILDIIRKLPGDTVFHWEVNPELVDDDFIIHLKGLEDKVQFEVGLQTTYKKSLKAISRTTEVEKALSGIKRLQQADIKLHADLIAGLPYENFKRFTQSFDDLYKLHPREIQLGFLKLLRGTPLRKKADKYNIVFESKPPYEVLYTSDISYDEIRILKKIAHLLEKYYNDGRFKNSLLYLVKQFKRPFDMYFALYEYCKKEGFFRRNHSLKKRYEILYNFSKTLRINIEYFRDLLTFDFIYFNGKQAMPYFVPKTDKEFIKKAKNILYDENWAKQNLPSALGLSGSEVSRYITYGYFNHDIPETGESKATGIIFLHKGKQTEYGKFYL